MGAKRLLLVLLAVLALPPVRSASPVHEGELQTVDWRGDGQQRRAPLGQIRIRYRISSLMNEPAQQFDILLEKAEQLPEVAALRLRADILSGGRETGYHIEFSPDRLVPRGIWSRAVAWRSPEWGQWFLDEQGHYASAAAAKRLFVAGLSLRNLRVLRSELRGNDSQTDLANCWRRVFVGNADQTTPLTTLLPVGDSPIGHAEVENEKRGWKDLRAFRGDLAGPVAVEPAGIDLLVGGTAGGPLRLCVWETADAVVLKGRLELDRSAAVQWRDPGERTRRALQGAVEMELLLELAWRGKREACRQKVSILPGQFAEMAIRLPVGEGERVGQERLAQVASGKAAVRLSLSQRPTRQQPEQAADPFATAAGVGNPFEAGRRDVGNPFEAAEDRQPAAPQAGNPFQPKPTGNAFERERTAEQHKQFLKLMEASTALLDGGDWRGAEGRIRQALAVPGHARDQQAALLLCRAVELRNQETARLAGRLVELDRLWKEIDEFVRQQAGEPVAEDDAKGRKARRLRVRQTFADEYVAKRLEQFAKTQRKAKAAMAANPALTEDLDEDHRALVRLADEPPPSRKTYK